MALWRLTPRTDTPWWCVEGKDPWQPPYGRAFGFVVRAADAEEARWLAHQAAGKENGTLEGVSPWLDENYSTCEEVREEGSAAVIQANFRHAPSEPEEMLQASQIVEEHPGDLGILLWDFLRDVTQWASVDPELREGLFTPDSADKRLRQLQEARVEPSLEVMLTTLMTVVRSPGTASPEIVTLVCMELSRWAQARGAIGTALAFGQAAALASPKQAAPACTVGSLALRWGRHAHAETWLRRAIRLARQGRDGRSYAQAHVEMGALYARRERPATARRYYTQAIRASPRHHLPQIRGAALHGLFLLAMQAGDVYDAERFARAAMRAYGRGHPRLGELLHEIAYLWVARESFDRAIPLLQKLLFMRNGPGERAFTLAVLARAAAGAGEPPLYEEAWSNAWDLINRPDAHVDHARTLLELARAAARLKDRIRMEQAIRLHASLPFRIADRKIIAELVELAADARDWAGCEG